MESSSTIKRKHYVQLAALFTHTAAPRRPTNQRGHACLLLIVNTHKNNKNINRIKPKNPSLMMRAYEFDYPITRLFYKISENSVFDVFSAGENMDYYSIVYLNG